MVAFDSFQALFGVSILVAVGLYLVHRQSDRYSSAQLAAIGSTLIAVYLLVAISLSLTNVF